VAPDLSVLPEPTALVPVAVNWTQGGSVVEVEGSFDNWQSRQALHRSGNREFAIVKMLPPGVYQYKFIVDGEWKYAPDQPAMYDEMGNVNNVLEVQEYVPEILDSLDSFLAPSSPPESYNNALFSPEDFAKEPPACPPHLHLTLLNVPQIPDAPNLLPRPMHTVLNHIYNSGPSGMGVQVMGTTHRYRRYVRLSRRNPTRSSRRVTAFARTFHRV
jgi:5'-AMP-activated protein kinase regulatory beta subunit